MASTSSSTSPHSTTTTHRRSVSALIMSSRISTSTMRFTNPHASSSNSSSSFRVDTDTPSHAHSPQPDSPSTSTVTAAKTTSRIMTSVRRTFASATPKKRWSDPHKHVHAGMISTPEERNTFSASPFRPSPDATSTRPTIEQIAMGLHISRTPHLRPLSPQAYPYTHSTHPHAHHEKAPHQRARTVPPMTPASAATNKTKTKVTASLPLSASKASVPARSSLKKPSTSTESSLDRATGLLTATTAMTATSTSSSTLPVPGLTSASASSTTVTSSTTPPTPQSASVAAVPASTSTPSTSGRSMASIKIRMSRFLYGYASLRSASAPSIVMSSSARTDSGSNPNSGTSSPRESTSDVPTPRKAVRFSAQVHDVEDAVR